MDSAFLIKAVISVIVIIQALSNLIGLPGNILIFITAVAYGFYNHFTNINVTILSALFALLLTGEVVEYVAGVMAAKRKNASASTLAAAFAGAILGGIIGTVFLPVLGSLIGAVISSFALSYIFEFSISKDKNKARAVAISVIKGQIFSVLFKFIVALGMAGLFIIKLAW